MSSPRPAARCRRQNPSRVFEGNGMTTTISTPTKLWHEQNANPVCAEGVYIKTLERVLLAPVEVRFCGFNLKLRVLKLRFCARDRLVLIGASVDLSGTGAFELRFGF